MWQLKALQGRQEMLLAAKQRYESQLNEARLSVTGWGGEAFVCWIRKHMN
jgi:hypothetical protein